MSASAMRRKAAEGLEVASRAKRIALNVPRDSTSRHGGPEGDPAARCGRVFADLP